MFFRSSCPAGLTFSCDHVSDTYRLYFLSRVVIQSTHLNAVIRTQHETCCSLRFYYWLTASCLQQVPPERVVSVHDVSNIYHVPLLLLEQSECCVYIRHDKRGLVVGLEPRPAIVLVYPLVSLVARDRVCDLLWTFLFASIFN